METIAWVVARLRDLGVHLALCPVRGQLDRESVQENNAVMRFDCHFFSFRVVNFSDIGFLTAGHTHEEIDMEHATLTVWLRRAEIIDE